MWNATFSYERREGGLLSRGGVTSSRPAAMETGCCPSDGTAACLGAAVSLGTGDTP